MFMLVTPHHLQTLKLLNFTSGKCGAAYFAIFRAMTGRGAISLAEKSTRPSTLAHTFDFEETRDVEGRGEKQNNKSSVRALRARFERELLGRLKHMSSAIRKPVKTYSRNIFT